MLLCVSRNDLSNNFYNSLKELEQAKLGSDSLLFSNRGELVSVLHAALDEAIRETSVEDLGER